MGWVLHATVWRGLRAGAALSCPGPGPLSQLAVTSMEEWISNFGALSHTGEQGNIPWLLLRGDNEVQKVALQGLPCSINHVGRATEL